MNTNLQSENAGVASRVPIVGFQSDISRRISDMRTLPWEGSVIKAGHIFSGAKAVQDAQAKQALAEKAQELAETATRKAEAANQAKTDFISNMSHEIRTPMGAIIGLADVLLATGLDDKQKKCLTVLKSSAEDLMSMINDQLDIGKIESKVINLEHAPFSMPVLLHQIVSLLSVKAQEKGVDLILHYDAELPKIFVGDSGRIRQIMMNLVGNAIKFTEAGGVTVSFGVHGEENGKKKISISVTDTGIGIPEDKMDVIFSRFAQADSSITRRFGGTGLGLSISKALAESMGGSMSVASVMGKGSTFTLNLELPVKQAL